jgi:hypothetical protein
VHRPLTLPLADTLKRGFSATLTKEDIPGVMKRGFSITLTNEDIVD